jgi:hypothetical protein
MMPPLVAVAASLGLVESALDSKIDKVSAADNLPAQSALPPGWKSIQSRTTEEPLGAEVIF